MTHDTTKAGAEETKQTVQEIRKQILAKHLTKTEDLNGVNVHFAYQEAMQEYAELFHSEQREKEASIQLSGAGEQLFRAVKCSERLPEEKNKYHLTDKGNLYLSMVNRNWVDIINNIEYYPTYWFEPVTLPMPVEDKEKKICPQKINGICPLHNVHCAYPKCEE